jgi:ketosteroid isomerase-like protein
VRRAAPAKAGSADASPWLRRLFAAIDSRDAPRFIEFLTEDATFRFGNQPTLQSKSVIHAAVVGFFGSIKACRHEVMAHWRHPDSVVCHGWVTYTRTDNRQVTVPFANVMLMRGERIREYYIFVDITPLYAD